MQQPCIRDRTAFHITALCAPACAPFPHPCCTCMSDESAEALDGEAANWLFVAQSVLSRGAILGALANVIAADSNLERSWLIERFVFRQHFRSTNETKEQMSKFGAARTMCEKAKVRSRLIEFHAHCHSCFPTHFSIVSVRPFPFREQILCQWVADVDVVVEHHQYRLCLHAGNALFSGALLMCCVVPWICQATFPKFDTSR